MANIKIPQELQHLEVDKRGFPIPFTVTIDKEGCPQFKVNDKVQVNYCLRNKVCHVCGKPLLNDMWLIGGQLSAFHPRGAFNDGPVHKVCGIYSLQTCPYMAYSRYKAEGKVDFEKMAEEEGIRFFHNPTQTTVRLDFFVFAKIKGYEVNRINILQHTLRPQRPYLEVEYWLDGKQITQEEVDKILRDKSTHNYTKKGL